MKLWELLADSAFQTALVILALIFAAAFTIVSVVAILRAEEIYMASQKLCYQAVPQTNNPLIYQWQSCERK